jgi:hypothetical protein
MLSRQGFFAVDAATAERLILDALVQGMRVFRLPRKISSKDAFFDGVRDTLPLDPPLQNNASWDALEDSVWSGLGELEENGIVIVWRDSSDMETQAPKDFSTAFAILNDLPCTLADVVLTVNHPRKLVVLQVV